MQEGFDSSEVFPNQSGAGLMSYLGSVLTLLDSHPSIAHFSLQSL